MSNTPIGIFDSGIGGLTIVKSIQKYLPNESIIYFGDTAHLPYGDKSPELIQKYAANITYFLAQQKVKLIIVACNTASAVALEIVEKIAGGTPVLNVIDPAVQTALQHTLNYRIGVIGTKTTIQSRIYPIKIREQHPEAYVTTKATPLLVPMIEEGWANSRISNEIIQAYLSETTFETIDTLILGCTHYPLIKESIVRYFENKVNVIDSADSVAKEAQKLLTQRNMLADPQQTPVHTFYVSDLTDSFQQTTQIFLDVPVVLQQRRWIENPTTSQSE
ncbi:MAG: glutamate racemase [Bacteroidia bacterium]|nr:glutamate racemase [Bacteroidia bacterium]MDW8348302.1 glutamate racemase [Bacteroidia bacterium]